MCVQSGALSFCEVASRGSNSSVSKMIYKCLFLLCGLAHRFRCIHAFAPQKVLPEGAYGRAFRRYCIGTSVGPVIKTAEGMKGTKRIENVTPVVKEKFSVRPELITFDACNKLIMPSQSIGRWYRDALNTACDMSIRLPRPELFQQSFQMVYNEMCSKHPCYGTTSGMTARTWWWQVIEQTYLRTQHNTELEPEEFAQVMPAVFQLLHDEVFGTQKGWVVKEGAEYTLAKLKQWRDVGAGPLVGVISNSDERLHTVLKGLGLSTYFDMVLTSEKCGVQKPDPAMFQMAAQRAGEITGHSTAADPALCFHVGSSVEHDIAGAAAAGWHALRYNEWFDQDFPGWVDALGEDSDQAARDRDQEQRRAVLQWGRRSLDRTVTRADGSTVPLEWHEMWALEDVLTLFGFPEDPNKTYCTTVLRGVYDYD